MAELCDGNKEMTIDGYGELYYESRSLQCSVNPARSVRMNENSSRPIFEYIFIYF